MNRPEKTSITTLLGRRRHRAQSSLGDAMTLGAYPLCEYAPVTPAGAVPYLNLHRAKGLDRLGVVLIDLPALPLLHESRDTDGLEALFADASRARQLLAVVSPDE